MEFDHPEAKGVVEIRRGYYGVLISVDGEELLDVDLFHKGRMDTAENTYHGCVAVHLRDTLADEPIISMYRKQEDGASLIKIVSENEDVIPAIGGLRREMDWLRLEDTSDD